MNFPVSWKLIDNTIGSTKLIIKGSNDHIRRSPRAR